MKRSANVPALNADTKGVRHLQRLHRTAPEGDDPTRQFRSVPIHRSMVHRNIQIREVHDVIIDDLKLSVFPSSP